MAVRSNLRRRKHRGITAAQRKKMVILGSAAAAAFLFTVLAIITAVFVHNRTKAYDISPLSDDIIMRSNKANAEKLMIVAHPDDETLWGGGHLLDGGYLVVCITNGRNEARHEEFIKAVNASGNAALILEYPDKVNGKRDNWSEVWERLESDIRLLTGYKKWKQIVTHNPEGEYGHMHHKMLSSIVTESCREAEIENNLWYFGEYFTKSKLPSVSGGMTQLPEEKMKLKEKMMDIYVTQKKCVDRFRHMAPYEEWTKAV